MASGRETTLLSWMPSSMSIWAAQIGLGGLLQQEQILKKTNLDKVGSRLGGSEIKGGLGDEYNENNLHKCMRFAKN